MVDYQSDGESIRTDANNFCGKLKRDYIETAVLFTH